ncbi:tRNA (adenosine(37)-N6)-threonylcarbamoyltransferase complex ATPase subunit type 1 TsaE [Blastococcus sp. Marseille-P5729]|uniref:tRNA (adenosine(37)-N6)-threonylcarbamoyltransferase complex ATPase subunit type 1 TsaE n=1 Tax=Blastococcus sp. Marseille-P5729 TaxID=2086582 RepID=UPI000D0EBC28|nr:tRNA (adenosine(37)-N6)-threonylcarbamoyltransferase complex ATPase subunit type 1 TsaE [Blastococcus sp. Marseille-P5729]
MSLPSACAAATPDELQAFAARVADRLRAGDLVILRGPLGAGKTTFAQGIGAGLGVRERLTSPTFVIARVHHGRLPVVHVDAYRIATIDELEDLGLDADLDASVTLVEWGSGLAEALSAEGHLLVDIERASDPDDETRIVRLEAHGPRWDETIAGEGA